LVVEMDDIRERYAAALQHHCQVLRRACADCMGDYCLIDTREAPELALRRLSDGSHT